MASRSTSRPRRGGILFLSPTEMELAPLLELLPARRLPCPAHTAVIGVGKASAACGATSALARWAPDLTVLVGCAGSLPGSRLRVGDVVIASVERFADEGVETAAGFLDLERMRLPMARRNGRPIYNTVEVAAPRTAAPARGAMAGFKLVSGPLATVSACSGTARRAAEVARRSQGLAETMEGAAVALAATLGSRALVEVRGISNAAGTRDRRRWDIPRACRHAAEVALWIAGASAVGSTSPGRARPARRSP